MMQAPSCGGLPTRPQGCAAGGVSQFVPLVCQPSSTLLQRCRCNNMTKEWQVRVPPIWSSQQPRHYIHPQKSAAVAGVALWQYSSTIYSTTLQDPCRWPVGLSSSPQ